MSHYNMVNGGVFHDSSGRFFWLFVLRGGLHPSREKELWCFCMAEQRQDSVCLHFLVVTISFVLRGSNELLVPRYLHTCVC